MPGIASTASISTSPTPALSRPLRVGFLANTDAAPFVVAEHLGLFVKYGLQVELRREIGGATMREKILYGELDAAQTPAPMLWSTQLGLGCPATDVLTAFVLNLHGGAITLSRALWEAGVRDAASLRHRSGDRRAQQPLTFGIVSHYSMQHLQLRDWLRAAGLDPDRDVRIVVVPSTQLLRNLAAGTIDGYCSSEPWNTLAVRDGVGWCPTLSAALSPGHVDKVLMVTRRFAEKHHAEHGALIAALAEACAWCDLPHNRATLATLLSAPGYLSQPAAALAPALSGQFDCGHGRVENVPDFYVFQRREANVPTSEKATVIQRSLASAGFISAELATDHTLPRQLFRDDLYHSAINLRLNVLAS